MIWRVATALFFMLLCTSLSATVISISSDMDLQHSLNSADAGDTIILRKGRYSGNYIINKPIILKGLDGAVIDGQGDGNTLYIDAPDVTISSLKIVNWGNNLTLMNAGVFVSKKSTNTHLSSLALHGKGFGIWVDGASKVLIENNKIQGSSELRSQDRGNGIHLFNVSGARVINNEVWSTRDGIYIDTSNGNRLTGNYLHDLRYGIHYMYSYHNIVSNNHTRRTRTGYALMQSKYLTVTNNTSEEDVNYGILMNFITHSTIADNEVHSLRNERNTMIRHGKTAYKPEGKAMFIYNSLFNQIYGNKLTHSDIGIHLTAGSEDNSFTRNLFINNTTQVKYVANRTQDWSQDGMGNYWSDYLGWDMNKDGIGDVVYEPNDSIDLLLWKYPMAKILFNSPSVILLHWVQSQFPVLKSPGVIDSHPLMTMPKGQ